jgi:hypothetical protein
LHNEVRRVRIFSVIALSFSRLIWIWVKQKRTRFNNTFRVSNCSFSIDSAIFSYEVTTLSWTTMWILERESTIIFRSLRNEYRKKYISTRNNLPELRY